MIYSKLFSLTVIMCLLTASSAFAFEAAGSIYRISGDVVSTSGDASGAEFKLVEMSFGSVGGTSAGATYMLNMGIVLSKKLSFLLVAPVFSPAEILVHFWRK